MTAINRIVQTLWTKPVFENGTIEFQNRFHGGWLSKKYNYMAWTLSCLQFRKFYEQVEIVTDKKGKELLIDKLDLPYTSIKIELDCLNKYPNSLWTLPKIYCYKIQSDPFIHTDGDVLIWEKFRDDIESARLVSQQLVIDHKPQYITMDEIEAHLNYIPDCITKDRRECNVLRISNAGLLGGTDLNFYKEFTQLAFDFVDKNLSQLHKLTTGNFGMIFEEYLFYCLAKEKEIDVTYLLEPLTDDFKGTKLVDFETVPSKTKFIHPVGTYKRYQHICDLLENTLLIQYPDYYYRILKLLHDFAI
jgi:hypothetical protein